MIPTRLTRRLSELFASSRPFIFLAGAIAIGLVTEGTIKLVESFVADQPATTGWWLLGSGIGLLTVLTVAFDLWRLFLALFGRVVGITISESSAVARRRGLVAVVSGGNYVPAGNALYHHSWAQVSASTLSHAYLLVGPGRGELSSQANAKKLKLTYEAKGVQVDVWELDEADNVSEMFEKMKAIYDTARTRDGLGVADMIADYTGGTKTMTTGMILAVAMLGGDLQFMKPNAYLSDGRADGPAGSHPVLVNVDFVTVSDKA